MNFLLLISLLASEPQYSSPEGRSNHEIAALEAKLRQLKDAEGNCYTTDPHGDEMVTCAEARKIQDEDSCLVKTPDGYEKLGPCVCLQVENNPCRFERFVGYRIVFKKGAKR